MWGACGLTDQKPIWIYDASAPVCCPLHFYSWQHVSALMHQIVPMETVCCVYEDTRAYLCRTHVCAAVWEKLPPFAVTCFGSPFKYTPLLYGFTADLLPCVCASARVRARMRFNHLHFVRNHSDTKQEVVKFLQSVWLSVFYPRMWRCHILV